MATTPSPTKSTLTRFAELMHRGFVKRAQTDGLTHMYALLVPKHVVLGTLEMLELSPLQAVHTARVGDQHMTIALPGATSLVMLPFSIPGNLYTHLQHMTLPRGTAALGLSSETWVHMVPRDADGNELGDPASVEPITGWSTTVVAPRGRKVHLLSTERDNGESTQECNDAAGRTLVAMREVILRSSR
jgi:hypothetical protein